MAGPKKTASIKEDIQRQEEVVSRVKEKYDSEFRKLKSLYEKQDEIKKKNRFLL